MALAPDRSAGQAYVCCHGHGAGAGPALAPAHAPGHGHVRRERGGASVRGGRAQAPETSRVRGLASAAEPLR